MRSADYRESATLLAPHADYLVINVSSPNTPGLRDLQAVEQLEPIVAAVREAPRRGFRCSSRSRPTSPTTTSTRSPTSRCASASTGSSRPTPPSRATGSSTPAEQVAAVGAGGVSGAPLAAGRSTVLRRLRARVGEDLVLIVRRRASATAPTRPRGWPPARRSCRPTPRSSTADRGGRRRRSERSLAPVPRQARTANASAMGLFEQGRSDRRAGSASALRTRSRGMPQTPARRAWHPIAVRCLRPRKVPAKRPATIDHPQEGSTSGRGPGELPGRALPEGLGRVVSAPRCRRPPTRPPSTRRHPNAASTSGWTPCRRRTSSAPVARS